jgi:UDPglucose 6-dehydrogenase
LSYLETRSEAENKKGLTVGIDPYEVCKDAHAIAILTEWDAFKTYDWQKIYDQMQKPAFVFDGRNLLNKKELEEIGFVYQAIGS